MYVRMCACVASVPGVYVYTYFCHVFSVLCAVAETVIFRDLKSVLPKAQRTQ